MDVRHNIQKRFKNILFLKEMENIQDMEQTFRDAYEINTHNLFVEKEVYRIASDHASSDIEFDFVKSQINRQLKALLQK